MKKLIVLLIATLLGLELMAQSVTKAQVDSIRTELKRVRWALEDIQLNAASNKTPVPRYKLYQTENIYNLLKLDTQFGTVYQIQYKMNNVDPVIVCIGSAFCVENSYPGRFELYPTKNTYTFIMLDTRTGDTYQVQWSTKKDRLFFPLK